MKFKNRLEIRYLQIVGLEFSSSVNLDQLRNETNSICSNRARKYPIVLVHRRRVMKVKRAGCALRARNGGGPSVNSSTLAARPGLRHCLIQGLARRSHSTLLSTDQAGGINLKIQKPSLEIFVSLTATCKSSKVSSPHRVSL